MTSQLYQRKTTRQTGPVVLNMVGPDTQVHTCIFCDRAFTYGDAWLKIGFPRVAYIGAHVACSAAKDAELARRKAQH